jgi:ubiquinone/menaquinone biosynthesis C-methylase UbiE
MSNHHCNTDESQMNQEASDPQAFWRIRSANYDKLYWTRDDSYLDEIVCMADLQKTHVALDVGTGTGAIARTIKPLVRHVVAIDISDSMLRQGQWEGISVVNWDIGESFFADATFDRVFARMVFHHILDNLDRAVLRCYDLLRNGGKIIVAEGVPPEDDPEIIEWFAEMFKYKEQRRTFTPATLTHYLTKNGFRNVLCKVHYMENFSISNWLTNSGLEAALQEKILRMHIQAKTNVKEAYRMRIKDNDCVVRTKNVILVGER